MRPLILAFQFLTIIPLRVKEGLSEGDLSRSTVFFPVVGAFQGLLVACVATVSSKVFSEGIASALAITVVVVSNGGFHLDGLADTFDALAVKSSGDKEADRGRRLAVMKDSATGAIGVAAIVLTILMKLLVMTDLLMKAPTGTAFSLLFLMPVFSKWVMVPCLYQGTSARQDGLGRAFIDSVTMGTVVSSSLISVLICFLVGSLHLYRVYGANTIVLFLSLYGVFSVFSYAAVGFYKRRFGGLTGDHFGAVNEITEVLYLFMVLLWLPRSI